MKKEKINRENVFKLIVMIYFIASPIFDVVFLYSHITTMIRVGVLFMFAIYVFVFYKNSHKHFWWLMAYYLAMGGYLVISFIHSGGFVSLVPGNFNYSLVSEGTTLLKLCMPFTILFILKYVKFSKNDFFRVVNSWIILVAGSIVILNVLGLSLSSYTNEIVHNSIFSWGHSLGVNETATKGWFMYANQETLLLLMMLVLAVYQVLFVNKRSILYVVLVILAMMMLGTRIGTYGGLLTLGAVIVCYLLYSLILKRKVNKWFVPLLGLCLVWYLVLPITPCNQRVEEIKSAHENIVKETSQKKKGKYEDNEKEEVVVKESDFLNFTQNINRSLVGEQFYTKFYPYEYDKEFWNGVLESQKSEDFDYRVLELMIVNRIVEIDDRWTDVLFGISNSRIQNVVNIEEDFVLHYYAYGIIGMVIALMFYWFSSVRLVVGVLKSRTFIDFSILCCFSLFVLGAFISGNNVNFLAAVVPLSFIVSFCNEVKE